MNVSSLPRSRFKGGRIEGNTTPLKTTVWEARMFLDVLISPGFEVRVFRDTHFHESSQSNLNSAIWKWNFTILR